MQSQVHLKGRFHRCNLCGNRFARRDTLRRHAEDECPKRFEFAMLPPEMAKRGRDGFKLAAETYDSNDGLIQRSPPLVPRIVNLKPSPSPDYLTSPERSPTPERLSRLSNLNSKGKRRHPNAQTLQGDAVLIDLYSLIL